ncbi:MAG: hypothetical protein ISR69_09615 [Gammaproteobacteria bacterium]|nr:hypothetical protein [Gammaproteobacteria bacterium]
MPTIPHIEKNVNFAPHVVLLGAGASIASYLDWGETGDKLPSMQDLLDTLDLHSIIKESGFNTDKLNFEAFYDDLVSNGGHEDLLMEIEKRTYNYFSNLSLPDRPTIYDYLVLSLREKDLIATFNWDPFLIQAYMRNEVVSATRRPRIACLHGNVMIGVCEKDKVSGINGRFCSKCRKDLLPSKLLYPVKHKDYNTDPYIKGEWGALQSHLNDAYYLTVFGYSAPVTDVEARELMLDKWSNNKTLELAQVEIVDTRDKDEIEKSWDDFVFSHHSGIRNNIFNSYLFQQPRRSCDAFAAATLMVSPWHSNPFPRFETLEELQEWVTPLIQEEEEFDNNQTPFTGNFLHPNKGDT